jgi:hypothetical protein
MLGLTVLELNRERSEAREIFLHKQALKVDGTSPS